MALYFDRGRLKWEIGGDLYPEVSLRNVRFFPSFFPPFRSTNHDVNLRLEALEGEACHFFLSAHAKIEGKKIGPSEM